MSNGWIGVDLDGTLAQYDRWRGWDHIGEPIPPMVDRVRYWIGQGKDVRIFTARIAPPVGCTADQQRSWSAAVTGFIQDWCAKHVGKALPVTNVKDFHMIELWDDRAVQVEANTGRVVGHSTRGL